jgi:hypothetical protein
MEKDVIGRLVGPKGSKQPAILEECMREVCVTARWHQNSQLVSERVMNFMAGMSNMRDDANFTKRMRELVEGGYVVFDKLGRWRVTEKGLACLIACADRTVKINAPQERI